MLNLDFADTAIIETIATARTIMAIVPNSGIMFVPIISTLTSFSLIGMTHLHENYHLYLFSYISVCIGIIELFSS